MSLLIFAVLRGFRGITAGHVSDHLLQPFMWLHLQTSHLSAAGYVLHLHIPDKLNSRPDMCHGLSVQLEQFCLCQDKEATRLSSSIAKASPVLTQGILALLFY